MEVIFSSIYLSPDIDKDRCVALSTVRACTRVRVREVCSC